MKNWIFRPCLMAVFLLMTVAPGTAHAVGEKTGQKIPVKVVRAVKRDFFLTLPSMGTIQYVSKVDVSSEIQGILSSVRPEEGERVEKGQVIAVVDQTLLRTQLKQAEAMQEMAEIDMAKFKYEVAKAGYRVKAAEVSMTKQADELASRKKLFKMGAITQSKLDEAVIAYEKAAADYQGALADSEALQVRSKVGRMQAEVRVEKTRADAEEIKVKIRKCRIISTISGIVASKKKWTGEHVGNGDSMIMTIMETGNVYAEVDVNEGDVSLIKVGQPATVMADAYPGKTFRGTVHFISPTMEMKSRTLKVRIKINNKELLLKPGMFARVNIMAGALKGAVAVPQVAVLKAGDGRAAVFVVLEGVAFLRNVETGLGRKGWVAILKGVKPGEMVVIEGQKGLRDLAPVQAEEVGTR